jgi:hypothetical protein
MQPYYHVTHSHVGSALRVELVVLDMCTFVCASIETPNFRCEGLHYERYRWRAQMVQWFEATMESIACTRPGVWCVVVGHWPAYSWGGNGPTEAVIAELVPRLEEYGVHAYFSGHDHNLQHISKGHVHYFVCGGGGYELHPELKPQADKSLNSGALLHYKGVMHGFMSVTVSTGSLDVSFISANGTLMHTVSLQQHRGTG